MAQSRGLGFRVWTQAWLRAEAKSGSAKSEEDLGCDIIILEDAQMKLPPQTKDKDADVYCQTFMGWCVCCKNDSPHERLGEVFDPSQPHRIAASTMQRSLQPDSFSS